MQGRRASPTPYVRDVHAGREGWMGVMLWTGKGCDPRADGDGTGRASGGLGRVAGCAMGGSRPLEACERGLGASPLAEGGWGRA